MKKIGIDAGGTLTKVAYEERGRLHVKTYPNHDMEKLLRWLTVLSPDAVLHITGGKSSHISSAAHKIHHVDEFQAIASGTRYLMLEENHKLSSDYILVSIGTGSSIFHVTTADSERIAGSGIGGGTLIGLGSLIAGNKDFAALTQLASKGNRENSDLLVKDIYAPNEPPVPGSLTAANFGKAHVTSSATVEDHLAALMQLIGETILSLAWQAAVSK